MWIIDQWRKFSQNQYDKWGSKLQGQYDDIKGWKDEDLKRIFKAFSEILPPDMLSSMTRFVLDICKKYGEEFAKKIIEKLLPNFEKKNKE